MIGLELIRVGFERVGIVWVGIERGLEMLVYPSNSVLKTLTCIDLLLNRYVAADYVQTKRLFAFEVFVIINCVASTMENLQKKLYIGYRLH